MSYVLVKQIDKNITNNNFLKKTNKIINKKPFASTNTEFFKRNIKQL